MVKQIISGLIVVGLLALLAGCATYVPAGALFVDGKTGLDAKPNVVANKTGKACMNSILGLVAFGDAGIETAMRDGNISNVATINYTAHNILGIYGTYCIEVTGN
jgi:hypothetical protein